MKRIAVAGILALLVIVGGFLAAGLVIHRSVTATFANVQRIRETRMTLFAYLKSQLDEETGVRGYADTHQEVFLGPYYHGVSRMQPLHDRLASAFRDLGLADSERELADATIANAQWHRVLADPVIRSGGQDGLATELKGKAFMDRFRADVTGLNRALTERSNDAQTAFNGDLYRLVVLIVVTSALLLLGGVLFLYIQVAMTTEVELERQRAAEATIARKALRSAYEAERRVSTTLQEAFSLRPLPAIAGIEFSARYAPATDEARVGGDWYDAFEIAEGRVLFVIGDIAGHGLEAAVAMSRVRNEMLVAAVANPDPASILECVNDRICSDPERWPMLTAIVGVADAVNYSFVYGCAGHPPPILLQPARAAQLLPSGGLGLGVKRGIRYVSRFTQAAPGATLFLYTDGVIEHSRDIIAGERELLDAVSEASTNDDPASAVYDAIFEKRQATDDVAILTVGLTPQLHADRDHIPKNGAAAHASSVVPLTGLSSGTELRMAS
jgi:serine phosphatase RsbU (regulator of sigma subunit)/CHASE3 domain sensor protein